MAGKHALLIGISSYGEGLQPIPSALLDVEAVEQVLLDPELGGFSSKHLQVLKNPGLTCMASAIENFYANKHPDDLLVLYFSGHGFRGENRQLLLSTAESCRMIREGRSSVQRATTLAARDVREFMGDSGSMRQVVILDCCYSAAFAEGMAAKDDGTVEIKEVLGGKGRAVLTSSDAIEESRFPESGDGLSVYTRFLVEGIQTGAADRHRRGWLDARDLHLYAESRVREIAPKMTPRFFPTLDGHSIRVCKVRRDPSVAYRLKVQELAEKRQGKISPANRMILQVEMRELGLDSATAARIEAEVLQPFVDYQQELLLYRETLQEQLKAHGQASGVLPEQDRAELQELAQRLKLRPADVAAIHQGFGILEVEPGAQAGQLSELEEAQQSVPAQTPLVQPQGAAAPGPALIQIPTNRGWLVREGQQWQMKSEPISVKGYEEKLAEGIGLRMVRLPAGEFQMGSPATEEGRAESEGPQHLVRLESFFLGQTPVTQEQWQVVAGWPKVGLDLNPNPSKFNGANKPVERVSWEDAMEFCRRLSERTKQKYTLPSEAQWEYACRAGSTTPFAFGETVTPDIANYDGNYTYGSGPKGVFREQTTEVGSFPANAWGLQDMHGNVWEWCLDHWHGKYQGAPSDGSAWAVGASEQGARLLRGGSWIAGPGFCRSALRNGRHRDRRNVLIGFRLCVVPPGLIS